MHSYLKAIGFSDLKRKKDLDKILEEVVTQYTERDFISKGPYRNFIEYRKDFSEVMGIGVRGENDENGNFVMEYYYPYFRGTTISTEEDVEVEKHVEKESYAGVCDDVKVGVTLIFYLQNVVEYLKYKEQRILDSRGTKPVKNEANTILSGLSLSGSVLLPIVKSDKQIKKTKETSIYRNGLIAAARDGDEDAIESLTLEDIDTYTMVSRRIMKEDIFSLVDSYFMPHGIETDQYSILGDITDCSSSMNEITKEEVYVLTINSNDLVFDLCINKNDLLGEPVIGRRFKGIVWLQGKLEFN